jgi:hypothetical protein
MFNRRNLEYMNAFFENKRAVQNLYLVIGCLVFAALFIMAGRFYVERVCLADTAYRMVLMIITKRPAIFPLRFGAFIPQILPLSAIWLHASLKTVMIINSLSFVILFFTVYIIAFRLCRSSILFFIIPAYLIMLTNEEFYWPQSEYQQGMIWLCLYAVLLFERKFETYPIRFFFLIHALLIFWIQTFHLLIFIPLCFLIIYFYSFYSLLFTKRFFIHISICTVSFIVRLIEGMNDSYESHKLNLGRSFAKHLPHFFSLGSVREFWHKLPFEYLGYAIVFIIAFSWLITSKKYLMAILLLCFSVFYWLLIIMTCTEIGRFYTEYLMLPLGFIAILPVVVEVIPRLQNVYIISIVLTFCIIRITIIYHTHIDYTKRLDIYQTYFNYINMNKLNGVFVDNQLIDQKKAIMTWGSGYESILISSLKSPDSCRVVQIDNDPNKYNYVLSCDTCLVTIYGVWDKSQLPNEYFKLGGGKYDIIKKKL